VDIFQPCVTFNRVNTYQWFRDNTYYLEDHNPTDRVEAFRRAVETGPYPLGIFYQNPGKKTFEENLSIYMEDERPLHQREIKRETVRKLIQSKKKI